ncbi:ROK family transcriptional regulator [Luteococcus sp. H138]|uniref:ROK family transcriptional regulator n=1 Tax=unclassified Luteococcus TaxID=2639923 RepID=UPI00313A9CE5
MNPLPGLDTSSRRVALAVLRLGPVSRTELGRVLGLSAPSLTRLTKPLVKEGLLLEGAPVAPLTTGRPAVPLDVDASRAHFLGVKFVRGEMYAVLTDLKGAVLVSEVFAGDYREPAAAVLAVAALMDWCGQRQPDGIGVCLGASVDETGMVSEAEYMGWPQLPLGTMIRERTGLPCVVENDVTAFTLAEHWFGFGRGVRDFLVVTLGAGVGAGLVCEDELVRGHRGRAGLIGGLRLDDGRRLQDVVETGAIVARLQDEALEQVLLDVAQAMGQLVGQLCAVTAPERVLVSGEGAQELTGRQAKVLTQALFDGVARYTDLGREQVKIDALNFAEWARGAATMAIRAHMTTA